MDMDVEDAVVPVMKEKELGYMPSARYLSGQFQPQLNVRMRAILIDWMIEVCQEFRLKRETLHYAVNFVDRYLSKVAEVRRGSLQLVGVTALFIASKIEEIYPPQAMHFRKHD